MGTFCHNICKKIPKKFRKLKLENVGHQFGLWLKFKSIYLTSFLKKLLRQVLESWCHLMLNTSLDASQCCNILKIEENITDYCVSWDFINFLFLCCTVWHTNKMNFIGRGKKKKNTSKLGILKKFIHLDIFKHLLHKKLWNFFLILTCLKI
jgi:hypothetical protein